MNSYSYIQTNLPAKKHLLIDQQHALESLSELRQYGFTEEQMFNWQGMYYREHRDALAYLCQKGRSPDDAIRIVSNLTISQAEGISAGLERDEVINFDGPQIKTLAQLKKLGLSADHLRNWQPNEEGLEYSYSHQAALIFLMQDKKLDPDLAMAEINKLTSTEADAIAIGLTRAQAIGLNRYQHKALLSLQNQGLTAELLRSWIPERDGFCDSHVKALKTLINEQLVTPDAAINEINRLSDAQATGIVKGLKRSEVIGLQEQQLQALTELKNKGIEQLTADMLREWQGDYFSHSHKAALINLIEKRHYSGQKAVEELNNLDEFEARSIAQKDLTRDEVFGFNGWQVDLLQELKPYGFTPAHMRLWIPHSKDSHFLQGLTNAVTYLVKQGMAPNKVMEEIQGLTNSQAERIAEGDTREQALSSNKRPCRRF